MTNDQLLDQTFEIRFNVTLGVKNFNDDVIRRDLLVDAAKKAVMAEAARQLQEAMDSGQYEAPEA